MKFAIFLLDDRANVRTSKKSPIFEMHCGYRVYEIHINSHMRREVYDYQNR